MKEWAIEYFNTVRGLMNGLKFGLHWEDDDCMPLSDHNGSKFVSTGIDRIVNSCIAQMHVEVFLTSYRGAKCALLSQIEDEFNVR